MDAAGSTIVKQREDAPERFYEAEAAGLVWLAEATARGGTAIDTKPASPPTSEEEHRG